MFDRIDQIGIGRPALRYGCAQHLERWRADLAGHQPFDQPDPGRRIFGWHGEIAGDDGLAVQQSCYRHQLAGEGGQTLMVEVLGHGAEPIHQAG
ncbi:Uncharacterised protein [Mycobacterium tuberculosis]|uniref:Uncharacterized protein n=1 Tax=Mycobacterium tuberculosis TaxID=1773 RepID=A0A916P800_MYCTX|nr:Uncharacterised protein [Mycobacterium tuberculosis]